MKLGRILVAPLAAAALSIGYAPLAAQTAYEKGRLSWNQGKYAEARPPLLTHRASRGGRTSVVDYMLGTSGCRLTDYRKWGARFLNYTLYSYPLSTAGRSLVGQELQRCRSLATLGAFTPSERGRVAALAPGATASGKLWHSGGTNPVPAHPARQIRPFWGGELALRIVPLGQAEQYSSMLGRIAPKGASVRVLGRFGFVSMSGHSDRQLDNLAAVLEQYTQFLKSQFELEPPDNYITVYLSPNISSLTQSADRVHNLLISPSTLGYAYPEDASVSAMIPGTQSGTLLHELFHLIVRNSFGDMPQWLDEGIAALYEVSRPTNGVFVGLPNWRGKLLTVRPALRPSLRQVITSPWFAFDGVSGGPSAGTAEARQLALARYFALYLQSNGLLSATFKAFRDRDPGAAEDPAAEAVEIVERIAGPLPQVETAFWTWFSTIGARDDNYLPGVIAKELPSTGG